MHVQERLLELVNNPAPMPECGQRFIDLRDNEIVLVLGCCDGYVAIESKRDGFQDSITTGEFFNYYRTLPAGVRL